MNAALSAIRVSFKKATIEEERPFKTKQDFLSFFQLCKVFKVLLKKVELKKL